MKKIFISFILLLLFFLISTILILSTIGIETNSFNNIISKKIKENNVDFNVKIETIKFKLDIKEVKLFLETKNPKISYRNTNVPAEKIKVFIDFLSVLKSEPKIKKIELVLNNININQIKDLSVNFKPSTLNSFLNNKITQGKISTEIEFYLNKDNLLENFIAKGSVSELKVDIIENLNFNNGSFSFFLDKTDVLIKNLSGKTEMLDITNGDIQIKLLPEVSLESNFTTDIRYLIDTKKNIPIKLDYIKNVSKIDAQLQNNFIILLDKTYKVKKYNYKSKGKIVNIDYKFERPFENQFLQEKIENISLKNTDVEADLNSNNKKIKMKGKYSFNQSNYLEFDLVNNIINSDSSLKINAEYDNDVNIEFINYYKPKKKIANVSINLEKKKDFLKLKKLDYKENKNQILLDTLVLKKEKFSSLKKVSAKTFDGNFKNNDFSIFFGKKIIIKGSSFDASNLPKIFGQETKKNKLQNINKEIEIDLSSVIAPLSEKLKNFKLIGSIKNGKFVKISSKGDFGNNNFLDITLKSDKKNEKKYLEIYSDIARPLLTEYNFFKGLSGGNLLFSSVIDKNSSNSKLRIENFKVINAPGMVKLLSLADLGGLADLAEGDGITFDFLEINMEKKNETLKLNEILALGPSISVLMEGYQDSSVTSLRGTLVPAKTLNNLISKIPVIGNIVIPKEVGEGLFGISFKMKGPPGNIKTTINPIKTITPRFIQKIIERNKKSK